MAISCFSEVEFKLLKATAKDGDTLDDTYEDWRKNVENFKKFMRESGVTTIYVELTVAEIEAFCLEHDLENNGATRARLVSEKAEALQRTVD